MHFRISKHLCEFQIGMGRKMHFSCIDRKSNLPCIAFLPAIMEELCINIFSPALSNTVINFFLLLFFTSPHVTILPKDKT